MSSRDLVMARVRRALADISGTQAPDEVPDGRGYLRAHSDLTPSAAVDLLAENLADYRATVHRTDGRALPALIARLLTARAATSVVVPHGLPAKWLSASMAVRVPDSPELTPHDLDAVSSVVTGCAVAIAETGTIVLDAGAAQGRRRITLVPDHHICVIQIPAQIVCSVPQALERLDRSRPLTWISGPSATSDIELDRVEGVHGPRTLEVVLVEEPSGRGPRASAGSPDAAFLTYPG